MDKIIYRKERKVEIDRGGYNNCTVTTDSHANDPDAVAFIRRDVVLKAYRKWDDAFWTWYNSGETNGTGSPHFSDILDAELEGSGR